jgi:hypothetical protein
LSDDSLRLFEDLDYPGRRKPINRGKKKAAEDTQVWSAKPKEYAINGVPGLFYDIGDLAKALGYSVQSIRAWEAAGLFPQAPFRGPRTKAPVAAGTTTIGRRLWTREHVEAILRAAKKHKVILNKRPPTIAFVREVDRAFYELSIEH